MYHLCVVSQTLGRLKKRIEGDEDIEKKKHTLHATDTNRQVTLVVFFSREMYEQACR